MTSLCKGRNPGNDVSVMFDFDCCFWSLTNNVIVSCRGEEVTHMKLGVTKGLGRVVLFRLLFVFLVSPDKRPSYITFGSSLLYHWQLDWTKNTTTTAVTGSCDSKMTRWPDWLFSTGCDYRFWWGVKRRCKTKIVCHKEGQNADKSVPLTSAVFQKI